MQASALVQIILSLSGLTQEKLAQELRVSFPTLNSWVRGRSEPRPQKRAVIEAFYRKITGLREISGDPLEAKKTILWKMKEKWPDLLDSSAQGGISKTNSAFR